MVKHRLTVTPIASVVMPDTLLKLRPCRRFVEALTRGCRVHPPPPPHPLLFDVLLNEATPINAPRRGDKAAHLFFWKTLARTCLFTPK